MYYKYFFFINLLNYVIKLPNYPTFWKEMTVEVWASTTFSTDLLFFQKYPQKQTLATHCKWVAGESRNTRIKNNSGRVPP